MVAATKKPKASPVIDQREKVYPEIKVELHLGGDAITADLCKRLLGWQLVAPGEDNFLFTDKEKNGVTLTNNASNRPFDIRLAEEYAQDILNKKWFFNGQSISIGEYGNAVSFQHRGVALVLANQLWQKANKHWVKFWPTRPTMEGVIVYGVPEIKEVINTLDSGRVRTFADNLYGNPEMFPGMKSRDREKLCKIVDSVIKILWYRTGAKSDAFSPTRTHSEAFTFLENHPHIKDVVRHIWDENKPDKGQGRKSLPPKIARHISLNWACALQYLMATSETDGDHYRKTGTRTEKRCDFQSYDKSKEFWTLLAGNAKQFRPLVDAIGALIPLDGKGTGSTAEKVAIICKAWTTFLAHPTKDLDPFKLKVKTQLDDNGVRRLIENVTVNGIDLGDPSKDEVQKGDGPKEPVDTLEIPDDESEISEEELEATGSDLVEDSDSEETGEENYSEESEEEELSEEELEARKAEVRAERAAKKGKKVKAGRTEDE